MSPVCCTPSPKSSSTAGAARLPVPRPPPPSSPVGAEAGREDTRSGGDSANTLAVRAGEVDKGSRACGRWGYVNWKVLGPLSLALFGKMPPPGPFPPCPPHPCSSCTAPYPPRRGSGPKPTLLRKVRGKGLAHVAPDLSGTCLLLGEETSPRNEVSRVELFLSCAGPASGDSRD